MSAVSTGPLEISGIDLIDECFTVTNTSGEDVACDGWKVHDQKVESGAGKRNIFLFEKVCPGLILGAGESVQVFSGPGSKEAREYDNKTTVHWFSYSVWDDSGDTGYLTNPEGSVVHKCVKDAGATPNGEAAYEGDPAKDAERTENMELTGECKWYHYQKGFGFISQISDGGSEVFVHNSAIKAHEGQSPSLTPGMKVQFKFTLDKDGRARAVDVTSEDGTPVRSHGSRRNPISVARLAEKPDIKLGWCKWFDPAKGYGFITPENSEDADVFCHQKAVTFRDTNQLIVPGQDLEYTVTTEEKDGKVSVRASDVSGPGGQPVAAQDLGVGSTLLGKRTAASALLPTHGGMMRPVMGRMSLPGLGLANGGGGGLLPRGMGVPAARGAARGAVRGAPMRQGMGGPVAAAQAAAGFNAGYMQAMTAMQLQQRRY